MTGQDNALAHLRAAVGRRGWSDDPTEMAPFLTDWRGRYSGLSPLLLRPSTPQEVAEIVCIAAEHKLALIPQGGNTGLVGGGVPDRSNREILVNLGRLNRIRSVSGADNSLVAEAGVVLTSVQTAASEAGRLFPLALGSQGSAQIGGLCATNAGGVNVLRYGTMRALVLGLEVVLADGSIFHGLSSLRKDNSGYDIKQLLIGSEGTLGIITAATLRLFPQPCRWATAIVGLQDAALAVRLLHALESATGSQLNAFELISHRALEVTLSHMPSVRDPLTSRHPWYVLLEASTAEPEARLEQVLEAALARALEEGLISDAVVAQTDQQRTQYLHLRESIPEAERRAGGAIKHDVALPIDQMPTFITEMTEKLESAYPGSTVIAFGHLGDGNVHFNLMAPANTDTSAFYNRTPEINALVYDAVIARQGSISAEHGIGMLKRDELVRTADPAKLAAMRAIKAALDPHNLFNPGRIF